MTLNNFIKILVSIIIGVYLDSRINFYASDYYLNFTLGFLIFCFLWTSKEDPILTTIIFEFLRYIR